MKIILTRHGRTEENDAGILQGHLPGKLNETGILQARRVAFRLSMEIIDHAYSSDLARATDTAEAIMKHHPGVSIEFTKELREAHLGEWQGKTKTELGFRDDPAIEVAGPMNGETAEAIAVRAKGFIEKILTKHRSGTVLLVGHDSINRRLVEALTGELPPGAIGNASVSVFEIDEKGKVETKLFNCQAHLQ